MLTIDGPLRRETGRGALVQADFENAMLKGSLL
jgi:hypothetical protein